MTLPAFFGIFALEIANYFRSSIYHFESEPLEVGISNTFHAARTAQASWSVYVGWTGVALCFVSAVSVYVVSRLMRNSLFLI